MERRVVVTGMGALSPLGLDVPTLWQAVREARSGVGPVTLCDTSGLESRIAGEVKGFDAQNYMDRKEMRRNDRFIHLAVAATREVLRSAELAITPAQQSVWDAYAAALKKNFTSMQGMRGSMMTALEGKTPVERLDAHLAAIESRHGALKGIKPVLATLYTALSDEQKKKADQILTGMGCMM